MKTNLIGKSENKILLFQRKSNKTMIDFSNIELKISHSTKRK